MYTMQNQTINRSAFVHQVALAFAILAILSGCAASYQVTRATSNKLPPRSLMASVEVINRGALPERPFMVLGKVFVEKSYGGWLTRNRDVDIIDRLKVAARDLGAEAIVDAHIYSARSSFSSDVKRWASGLAVTFNEKLPEASALPFIIVIPKVTGPSLGQHEAIRQYVQYELENRGYYAMVSDDSLTASSLAQLSPTDLNAMRGSLASQVLLIEYRLATESETDHTVRASLVRDSSQEASWENAVGISPGEQTSELDPDVILAPNGAAIRRGIRKLISTLPRFVTAATLPTE